MSSEQTTLAPLNVRESGAKELLPVLSPML